MNTPIRHPQGGWHRAAERDSASAAGPESQSICGATRIPRLGLALSAGGARGLAHIGVIQVLEEHGIPICAIAGTSMGAYVGSLWAAGVAGLKLEELAREIKDRKSLMNLMDPVFPPSAGLIRGEKIRRHLERNLGTLTFEELPIPLLVIATDLDGLMPKVFESGPVASAVHASAAIPGVCAPVSLDGRRYTDGGASEPLPVSLLQRKFNLDHVIAVNVMPTSEDIEDCRDAGLLPVNPPPSNPVSRALRRFWTSINLMAPGNVIDTFKRALMAAQVRLVAKECERASVVMHPFFCQSTWYDFENFDRYIAAGREAALKALPQIRALLGASETGKETDHEDHASPAPLGLRIA